MKTFAVSLWISLCASMSFAQELDHRPERQKAQDVYIEPTLRMTVTKITSSNGEVIATEVKETLQNHEGQVIQGTSHTQEKPVTPTATPIISLPPKEITDMSRILPSQ